MWRAHLADGRVVDHDGDNTPQHFLPQIVRFEVFAPNGAKLAEVDPGPRDFVIWRWVRERWGSGDDQKRTAGCKLGILNRDTGEASVREWDGVKWTPTDDVVLTPVELA